MREMKDSGIEWIGQIPKHWKIKKPKYIGSIRSGDSVTNKKLNDDIGYEVLGGNGTIGFYDKYNVDGTHIIIGRVGALCGNSRITRGKKFISDNALIYTCFEGQAENYINYIFDAFNLNKLNTSNAQPLITGSKVLNIFIPYPYIIEQKIIADFLDSKCSEIDATAEDIQKEISLLEEYKKSVITEAVTKGLNPDAEMKDSGIEWIGEIPKHWKVLRIKNVGEYRNGLTYKPTDLTDENTGTLVLRSSNIQDGKISLNDNVYVSTFVRSDLKVKKGDILICSRNGSRELVGKNAIIEDLKDVTFGAFMMIFRCNSPKYLYYILNSKVFSYYLGSFFTSTINQLTGSNFGNMKIVYVGDKLEQSKIVSYLDSKCSEIDSLIADKKRQLDIIADYKKSLIYEYVTGKKEVPVNE